MVSRLSVLFSLAVAAVAAAQDIPAAEIISRRSHIVPGPLRVTELFFRVPLDYNDPEGETIELFGRSVTGYEVPIVPPEEEEEVSDLPYMVYLEGGPGFGNREPQNHPLTSTALERGYQVLYLDHRGTGYSTPVSTNMLNQLEGGEDAQVEYLRLMRQDNTVRDCEAVRKALTSGMSENQAKWSIFGQSYGGFVSLSYLSLHPEGLREVFLTGGLAPVGRSAQEVYEALYPRVMKRNEAYYRKFPEDIQNVRQVARHIESQGGSVDLPAGGSLTVPRLMTIGIDFGGAGGFDYVHTTIKNLKTSLDQFGFLTRASLVPLETFTTFDTNIIYAILHEAIYCNGPNDVSNWASDRVAKNLNLFSWLSPNSSVAANSSEPLLFAGENIFPFFFDTYPELIPLKGVANKLAAVDDWTYIYNQTQLARNEVPVYAASYIDDLYVDYEFAKDTANLLRGVRTWETNAIYHSGLRTNTAEVLGALFNLRNNVID
ncbi:Alpha/Beta hydrolase protein [Stachybotrys elegans]|uniref:Alpha/Beta hydrolase protein n=1 Tax=Stachybotrys elegans TaxID=80388 RepID=A0A8K0WSB1_9HYPO|nr:Alpha/Beta hydrolase protein [Stachybotrys elegans]